MNILFFLLPKTDVEYVYDTFTIRQIIEKMEYHHYSAIPVIDKNGKYLSTISDTDLLKVIKDNHLDWEKAMKITIKDVQIARPTKSIRIDKQMYELFDLIVNQNFVPVTDDRDNFIGIITRKSVIEYMSKNLNITK